MHSAPAHPSLRARLVLPILALALSGGIASAQDQPRHYALEGRFGTMGPHFDSTLSLTKRSDGRYDAVRSWQYRSGAETAPRLGGVADVKVTKQPYVVDGVRKVRTIATVEVTFAEQQGARDHLSTLVGRELEAGDELTGVYRVVNDEAKGWVAVRGRNGEVRRVFEYGGRTSNPVDYGDMRPPAEGAETPSDPDAAEPEAGDPDEAPGEGQLDPNLQILYPREGVFLAGQHVRLRTRGGGTVAVLEGPAQVVEGMLRFTGPGEVKLQLANEGRVSRPVELEAVEAEVVRVVVHDTLPMVDAEPPHFTRELGEQERYEWEPALIFADTQLRLQVTLKASKDLSQPVRVRLRGEDVGAELDLEGQVNLRGLTAGETVELISATSLNEGVDVNALEIDWTVDAGVAHVLSNSTALRVYTTYAPAVENPMPRYGPTERQGQPLRTKLHYELACKWAQGASENVGDGPNSIGHKVDNAMRHLVHWDDYGPEGEFKPAVPHYAEGAPKPLNYSRLRGSVYQGERRVGSLFYPSANREGEIYNYDNYVNNFGWYVLENPRYPGGRCNQQASLVVDIMGTLGIRGEVYYIERVGVGKVSGRVMRRFYYSNISGALWNFHGQAKIFLADGSAWLYDGSGSSPPRRINGRVDELMAVPGRYVKFWEAWVYDDGNRSYAPMNDWPDTWHGVPIQPGEPPLDPNAPDGTYAYEMGRGTMEDGTTRTFYVVNVNGQFREKIDAGTLEAEDYIVSRHGKIVDWHGR